MGWYRERVVPRLVDRVCANPGMDRYRASALEGLHGRVVEIGFGSGANIAHYPAEVTEVLAVEPAALAREMAQARARSSSTTITHVGLDGQDLALDDDSCDAALSTFTLCTVPDPARALGELRRVIRPGGSIHVLEHGLAPDLNVARWQHRLDPLERRVADGCELSRDPVALLEGAGLTIRRIEQRYARGPKPWSFLTIAVAVKDVT